MAKTWTELFKGKSIKAKMEAAVTECVIRAYQLIDTDDEKTNNGKEGAAGFINKNGDIAIANTHDQRYLGSDDWVCFVSMRFPTCYTRATMELDELLEHQDRCFSAQDAIRYFYDAIKNFKEPDGFFNSYAGFVPKFQSVRALELVEAGLLPGNAPEWGIALEDGFTVLQKIALGSRWELIPEGSLWWDKEYVIPGIPASLREYREHEKSGTLDVFDQ